MQNTIKTTAVMILSCLAFATHAQQQAAAPEAAIKKVDEPKFDINFPGGTVHELVEVLQKSTGNTLNVLIPPELANTPCPRIQFKSVDLPSVFNALDLAQANRAVQWANVNNVMVLMARPRSLETGVFYVGDLLSKFAIDDVTTAVQTAWAMSQDDSKSELKYHKDTQLLIVRVPKEKLVIVKNVLSELSRAAADPSQKKD